MPTLSLYITSLMVDYSNTDYEMSTSMFAAIKCQDDRVGERGARVDWAWEYWHNGWVFRQESEVWGQYMYFLAASSQSDPVQHRMPFASAIITPREPADQGDRLVRYMRADALARGSFLPTTTIRILRASRSSGRAGGLSRQPK